MAAINPQPPSEELLAEKLAALDTVPLFMKSLPDDDAQDTTISALQSLAHDGTPDGWSCILVRGFSSELPVEIAQNFKELGNEYFAGKRWREAVDFYTQGVDAKPTDARLQEALLCNRAACNLELSALFLVLACLGGR